MTRVCCGGTKKGEVNPTGELKEEEKLHRCYKKVSIEEDLRWMAGVSGNRRLVVEDVLYQNKGINQERRKHRNQET